MYEDSPWTCTDAAPAAPSCAWSDSLAPAVLDELDYPVMWVDRCLVLRWANRVGHWLLAQGAPLARDGTRLQPLGSSERESFARAVSAAVDRGLRRWLTLGGQAFAVSPLGRSGALVIGARSSLCQTLSIDGFARQCRLSSSEAQVLHALCAGRSPAQIARERGVKLSTVRTQLGTLRTKIGAKDIRALVRLVGTLPPMVQLVADEPLVAQ